MLTGSTTSVSGSASSAINSAFAQGNSVYLNPGTYTLSGDVLVSNKINAQIVGNGATIIGNGHKIIIYGDNYTDFPVRDHFGFNNNRWNRYN